MSRDRKIKSLAADERPRERCLRNGAHALSLRECLAVILGSGPRGKGCLGVASDILDLYGAGIEGEVELEHAFFSAFEAEGIASIRGIRGIGEANNARLAASFELGRRYSAYREAFKNDGPRLLNLDRATKSALEQIPRELRTHHQEWVGFVPLKSTGKVGAFSVVERGVRTHVNFETAEFFARLLATRPAAFFMFHNHPTGNLRPSKADRDLTKRIRDISESLGVPLLRHLVVSARAHQIVD